MLFLGHVGIGNWLGSFVRPRLPLWPLVLGTLLPDLIDKPLYYGFTWATGKHTTDLGLISGARTFGHTLLFCALLFGVFALLRSRWWLALGVGVATHLLLDNWFEPFQALTDFSGRIALLFPLYGWRFPVGPYTNIVSHAQAHFHLWDFSGELLGLFLILWELWRWKRRRLILAPEKIT